MAGISSPAAKVAYRPHASANPRPSCIVDVTCPKNAQEWGPKANLKDFMGKRSQLNAKPNTNVLFFSYGKGAARGSLSLVAARWEPNPKRTVVVGVIATSGATTVTLRLDSSRNMIAKIVSGGITTTLTKGTKNVGGTTVTVRPAARSASIVTPTLTSTITQIGFKSAPQRPAGVLNVRLAAPPHLTAPFGGLLATSYETAVARAHASGVAGATAVLGASVTNAAV